MTTTRATNARSVVNLQSWSGWNLNFRRFSKADARWQTKARVRGNYPRRRFFVGCSIGCVTVAANGQMFYSKLRAGARASRKQLSSIFRNPLTRFTRGVCCHRLPSDEISVKRKRFHPLWLELCVTSDIFISLINERKKKKWSDDIDPRTCYKSRVIRSTEGYNRRTSQQSFPLLCSCPCADLLEQTNVSSYSPRS